MPADPFLPGAECSEVRACTRDLRSSVRIEGQQCGNGRRTSLSNSSIMILPAGLLPIEMLRNTCMGVESVTDSVHAAVSGTCDDILMQSNLYLFRALGLQCALPEKYILND